MITVLLYIAAVSGGLLLFLLSLSILLGMDFDLDIGDADVDGGGLGVVKGILAFLSLGAWVARAVLLSEMSPTTAYAAGVVAGLLTVVILHVFFKWLLRNQVNTNWSPAQALHQEAQVYLRIPAGAGGTGLIRVNVNGADRELKARTDYVLPIPTGARVIVQRMEDDLAVVIPFE